MPAERTNALGNLQQLSLGGEVHQAFQEIETNAAYTGFVEVLELGIADVARYRGHTARAASARAAGVGHRAIVRAVTRGLDYHVAGEPKIVAQRVELGFACVAGGVLALGGGWEVRSRPEHVAVGSYRGRRQLKAGTGGV